MRIKCYALDELEETVGKGKPIRAFKFKSQEREREKLNQISSNI